MHTHKSSGYVQFWHKWDCSHVHTTVSHVQWWLNGSHAHSLGVNTHSIAIIHTHWVFRDCSHSLIGLHAHSMGVQGVFNTHSFVFKRTHKCSEGVQYSLKDVQPVQTLEGPIDMFSNMQIILRPYKFCLNFHWMPFLRLCQARRHDIIEDMIGRWSRCPPMRLATKNKKVLEALRKLDILQILFH